MSVELDSAIAGVPNEIRQALKEEYRQLETRFARGDWAPAQLNGGRFAEAVLRYLEWKRSDVFTPVGTQLNRSSIIGRVRNDKTLPDGIRFHVSACAELLMDIRNKRDVAHLGAVVNVKAMDAQLVMRLVSWSLSEIIREESGLPGKKAQVLIDRLSDKRLALVEEIDGRMIVVATDLTAADRALVALYQCYPESIGIPDLREAVQYQNATRFQTILSDLARKRIVYVQGERCRLTTKGTKWVEKHIEMHLEV